MADPTLTETANELLDEYREKQRHRRRSWFYTALAMAGVFVAILAAFYLIPVSDAANVQAAKDHVTTQLSTVSEQANISADTQILLCLGGDETAKKLEAAGSCAAAQRLKQLIAQDATPGTTGAQGQAGKTGAPGPPGVPGRGITATAIVDGHYKITYSDGTTEDKGQIVGQPGPAGRGITGSTLTNGHLVLIYSDGATEDVGQVVGKDGVNGTNGTDGKNGVDGKDGRGITAVTVDGNHLIIHFSDSTTTDLGPLPEGPQGIPGQPPVSWTVHNADGTTTTCQRTASFDYQNPTYDCPAPTVQNGLIGKH